MNLFRSEHCAQSWSGYDDTMSRYIKPVAEWAEIFSNQIFRQRGRADYISWIQSEAGQAAFGELRAALA